jgi:three-Cys-motif partner protein
MTKQNESIYDVIGIWSEIKLDIIKSYATEYSKILGNQSKPSFYHIYIDAFAGAGQHVSKSTGCFVKGSPTNALNIQPPFKEYFFIDLEIKKVKLLEDIAGQRDDVHIFHGDCNDILIEKILPKAKYEEYRRALCILDPYGLHLNWNVVKQIAEMRSIEIFLNFPILDMNRNVFRKNQNKVSDSQINRMNIFWGDESWREVVYKPSSQLTLFGEQEFDKSTNEKIAEAYRKRLKDVAGFAYVPQPIPMKNTVNSVLYYLFFATHKPVAKEIVNYIFNKYRNKDKN